MDGNITDDSPERDGSCVRSFVSFSLPFLIFLWIISIYSRTRACLKFSHTITFFLLGFSILKTFFFASLSCERKKNKIDKKNRFWRRDDQKMGMGVESLSALSREWKTRNRGWRRNSFLSSFKLLIIFCCLLSFYIFQTKDSQRITQWERRKHSR